MKSDKYVIAVSGGIDSVVLLDMIFKKKLKVESLFLDPKNMVIAHFDHGIRKDSAEDRIFVEELANKYGIEFYFEREELGPNASEALARERRYKFLRKIMKETGSEAVITAHHQDDLIETVTINLIRGTKRKGLSSLSSKGDIIRPMLGISKSEVKAYADENNLSWREDETNLSDKYLRNKLRKKLSLISSKDRQKIIGIINQLANLNNDIDDVVEEIYSSGVREGAFDRKFFISLNHGSSKEILAYWLRRYNVQFDKKLIEKLTIDLKVGKNKSKFDINDNYYFEVGSDLISVKARRSV